MRTRYSILAALGVLVTAAVIAAAAPVAADTPPSAAGQTVFVDDFEDGNTDGWNLPGTNGRVDAVTTEPAPNGGSYVGRVTFASSCWGPSTDFPLVAAASMSWYFRTDGDTGHDSGVGFGVGTPNGLLALISYHNGMLRYRDNQSTGTYFTLQSASMATWYLIELREFDWNAGTYDIWIDGVEKVVGAPFMAADLVGATRFFNYACPWVRPGPSYIDDLTVTVADEAAPTVTITTPADQADYVMGTVVAADYTCADDGSGVASCVGPVPVGDPIDTTTLGAHDFSVTATDNAGNTETMTHSYTVSANTPPSKNDCKNGGWQSYTDDQGTPFRNQGDCVSYVATGGTNIAAGGSTEA